MNSSLSDIPWYKYTSYYRITRQSNSIDAMRVLVSVKTENVPETIFFSQNYITVQALTIVAITFMVVKVSSMPNPLIKIEGVHSNVIETSDGLSYKFPGILIEYLFELIELIYECEVSSR